MLISRQAAFIGIECGLTAFIAYTGERITHENEIRGIGTDAFCPQDMRPVTQVIGQQADGFYRGAVDVANRKLAASLFLAFLRDGQAVEPLPAL